MDDMIQKLILDFFLIIFVTSIFCISKKKSAEKQSSNFLISNATATHTDETS